MTWRITAEPQRFDEAVEWFKRRVPMTKELAVQLERWSERAFTIAGVAQLDIIQELQDSLAEAIAKGTPFDDWAAEAERALAEEWGRPDSARVETIFRNATSQALNAGRWRQITDPDVLEFRPFGRFEGIDDSRQTPICRECDGTILPLSHPWWATHSPQLHHRCRSSIRSLTEEDAARLGGVTAEPPGAVADDGFGGLPLGEGWEPDAADYDADLFSEFVAKRNDLAAQPRQRVASR